MDEFNFGFAVTFRDAVSRKVAQASSAIQGLWTSIQDLKRQVSYANTVTGAFSGALSVTTSAVSRTASALVTGSNAVVGFAAKLRKAAGSTNFFARSIQVLTVYLGAHSLFSAFTDVIAVGSKFEQNMAGVKSVVDDVANNNNFQRLTEFAKMLGRTTVASAREAAEGEYILGQAGRSTKQIMNELTPSLYLAKIGNISLAKSSEIVVSTLNQFPRSVKTAEQGVNILAAAANASQTDIMRLASAARAVGPFANTMGISMTEVAASVALFAQSGTKGEQAGVALRNIMAMVMKPSKHLTESLGFLHKKMSDVDLRTHTFSEVMTTLAPLATRADLAFSLFGLRTGGKFLEFLQHGTNGINDMIAAMGKQKTAAEVYEVLTNTVEGATARFANSLEDVKLSLYDALRPAYISMLKRFAGWWFNIAAAIRALRPAIDFVFQTFSSLVDIALSSLRSWFGGIGGFISRVVAATKQGNAAVEQTLGPLMFYLAILRVDLESFFSGLFEGFQRGYKAARFFIDPVLHALGWVLDGVMSLTGALDKNGDKWHGLGLAIGQIVGFILTFKAATWLLGIPAKIIFSWISWGASAVGNIAKVFSWLSNTGVLTGAMSTLQFAIRGVGAALSFVAANPIVLAIAAIVAGIALLIIYWDQIRAKASQLSDGLILIIQVLFPVIGVILLLAKHWDAVTSFMRSAWDLLSSGILKAWQVVSTGIVEFFRPAFQFVSTVFRIIGNIWLIVWNSIVGTLAYALGGIVAGIKAAGEFIGFIFTKIGQFISYVWTAVTGAIVTGVKAAFNFVASAWGWLADKIRSVPIFAAILDTLGSWASAVKDAFTSLFSTISKWSLPSWLQAVVDWVLGKTRTASAATASYKSGGADFLAGQLGFSKKPQDSSITPAVTAAPTAITSTLVPEPAKIPTFDSSAFKSIGKGMQLNTSPLRGSTPLVSPDLSSSTFDVSGASQPDTTQSDTTGASLNFGPNSVQIVTQSKNAAELARELFPELQKLAKENASRGRGTGGTF
ncbi:phage tail tape measure protein [Candidatus Parcubacteria bacterium]|nr:phage tail tape measure protein [Candidatus Parcubacteria bacterium]